MAHTNTALAFLIIVLQFFLRNPTRKVRKDLNEILSFQLMVKLVRIEESRRERIFQRQTQTSIRFMSPITAMLQIPCSGQIVYSK